MDCVSGTVEAVRAAGVAVTNFSQFYRYEHATAVTCKQNLQNVVSNYLNIRLKSGGTYEAFFAALPRPGTNVPSWTAESILSSNALPSDFWSSTPWRAIGGSSNGWDGIRTIITNFVETWSVLGFSSGFATSPATATSGDSFPEYGCNADGSALAFADDTCAIAISDSEFDLTSIPHGGAATEPHAGATLYFGSISAGPCPVSGLFFSTDISYANWSRSFSYARSRSVTNGQIGSLPTCVMYNYAQQFSGEALGGPYTLDLNGDFTGEETNRYILRGAASNHNGTNFFLQIGNLNQPTFPDCPPAMTITGRGYRCLNGRALSVMDWSGVMQYK